MGVAVDWDMVWQTAHAAQCSRQQLSFSNQGCMYETEHLAAALRAVLLAGSHAAACKCQSWQPVHRADALRCTFAAQLLALGTTTCRHFANSDALSYLDVTASAECLHGIAQQVAGRGEHELDEQTTCWPMNLSALVVNNYHCHATIAHTALEPRLPCKNDRMHAFHRCHTCRHAGTLLHAQHHLRQRCRRQLSVQFDLKPAPELVPLALHTKRPAQSAV